MLKTVDLRETATLTEATRGPSTARRFRARIIEGDRWGSSGYYSRALLERDGPAAWPQGTHMYFDHPTLTEDEERPERSVRDLAATIASTPVYEADGPGGAGLYADVDVYPQYAQLVSEMADDIGVSVRANATYTDGEVDGRTGRIIEQILPGVFNSVDFVTHAGAGGRLVTLMESARRSVTEASANDTLNALSDAVTAAYNDGDEQWAWVRDYDPDAGVVYYDVRGDGEHATWRQAYEIDDDGEATLTGERVEVRVRTQYTPVGDATETAVDLTREAALTRMREARNIGQWMESRIHLAFTQLADDMFGAGRLTRDERIALSSGIGEALSAFVASVEDAAPQLYSRDLWVDPDAIVAAAEASVPDHPAGQSNRTRENTMPQIEEARLRELEEAHGRVPALEQERDTERQRADTAERDLAVERARNYARDYGTRRVRDANADLPGPVVERIVTEAMREIPLGDDQRLDTEAFNARVDEARQTEETYLAGISETTGRVSGLGGTAPKVTEAQVDDHIADVFGLQRKGA